MDKTLYKIPDTPATHSMIWMHGLGSNAQDMQMLAQALQLPNITMRFAFMNAPVRFVTVNANMPMPAWYDIKGTDLQSREDRVGIEASQERIHRLIDNEIAQGITPENIFLAGFSQGGAMALYAGLSHERPLAGLIALSAYLPLRDDFKAHGANQAKSLPLFMASGLSDTVVLPKWSEGSRVFLQELGFNTLDYHSYDMAHAVCPEEIIDLSQWLQALCTKRPS